MSDEETTPTSTPGTEDRSPEDSPRPETLIRTPESDSAENADQPGEDADAQADDEDLSLRLDTQEWQEYPSPKADPPPPESVAERMTGADGEPADADRQGDA